MMPELDRIYLGDALTVLRSWPDSFVHCVVTSPPYWHLRDYCVDGQIGLERTPEEFVEKLVAVFAEVRRILRDDGTCWINMGDCYATNAVGGRTQSGFPQNRNRATRPICGSTNYRGGGIKGKDLIGQPWMLAFALRSSDWYLRQDIIWSKPNPMPESITDRCTKAHDYIFLLSKSKSYYFDQEAIAEPASLLTHSRGNGINPKCAGWADGSRSHKSVDHAKSKKDIERDEQGLRDSTKFGRGAGWRVKQNESFSAACKDVVGTRNRRSVWTISYEPFPDSHFATFPTRLVSPCILAGSPAGGIILDPFMGAGTTALVASRFNRHFLGIELNSQYIEMAERRIAAEVAQGKFL